MTDSGLRLRSESAPNAERSARVARNAKEVEAHRRAIADEFRAQLLAELPPSDSVVRRALVESCVSAYVEISVISARFQQGRATDAAMERLGIARGSLNRTLRLLGALPANAANDVPTDDPASWLARHSSAGSDGT